MGTPIRHISQDARVAILAGNVKFDPAELTPEERLQLVMRAVEAVKPILQYLSGLEPLMPHTATQTLLRGDDLIVSDTPCLTLARIRYEEERVTTLHGRLVELVLGRNGVWALRMITGIPRDINSRNSHAAYTGEVLMLHELQGLLSADDRLLGNILLSIGCAVEETIKQREERLDSMRATHRRLGQISDLLPL